jgi:hypothetical protein
MAEKKLEIIVIRETFAESIKSDVCTFGFLLGGAWINHWLIGGSAVVNVIIGLMMILTLCGKLLGRGRMSPDEAIAFIEKLRSKP